MRTSSMPPKKKKAAKEGGKGGKAAKESGKKAGACLTANPHLNLISVGALNRRLTGEVTTGEENSDKYILTDMEEKQLVQPTRKPLMGRPASLRVNAKRCQRDPASHGRVARPVPTSTSRRGFVRAR